MPAYTSGIPKSGMLEVGIALVLHDQFTTGMDQATKETRRLYQDAKNGIISNLNAAVSVGEWGENFFGGMATSLMQATSEASEFVDTMTTVGAVVEATDAQMVSLQKTAREWGFKSIFSIPEIGSGMKYLAMAGANAQEIQSMMGAATNVAGATGLTLGGKGGAADVITNVMRTFQVEMDSAEQVGDIMTKATLRSNMNMSDMAASIRYASADITNLGYGLAETSAMIGTLGNMGIQGSMAGTALANMARYLSKSVSDSSYKGHAALASLGLTTEELTDAQGNLLEIDKILEKLRDATSSLNSVDRANVFTSIFGVRGNRAATALMRDLEGYRSLLKEVEASAGYASQMMERRMDSWYGVLERLRESVTNLKIVFTQTVEPIIKPMAKAVTTWLQGLAGILEIPIFGKVIGFFTVLVPVMGRAISTLVKWRAMYLLLTRSDTIVTLKNIWSILTGGWSQANVVAGGYLSTLRQIQAAHQAITMTGVPVMGGTVLHGMGGGAAGGSGKKGAGGSGGGTGTIYTDPYDYLRHHPTNKPFSQQVRETVTATDPVERVRQTEVIRKANTTYETRGGVRHIMVPTMDDKGRHIFQDAKTGKTLSHTDPKVTRKFADVVSKTGKSVGAGAKALTTVGKIGSKLASVGGGLVTLMGGPWGIALTAISVGLPYLIGAIRDKRDRKKNSEALKANTEASRSNTAAVGTLASKYETKEAAEAAGKTLSYQEEVRLLRKSIDMWISKMENGNFKTIDVYLKNSEGKVLDKSTIDEYNTKTKLALGIK